ncbi:hypothetical protein F2Q69_00030357 [Brassica cretica]|uniref:Retrotransposon gag domain-containing protein n=1 Tax=Brassica cretica TaxID=69181 RepID=A0A8S9RWP1_BRACR|nr:hypothetical protein F2Q69_00030357 [Brassica cretica]
MAVSTWPDISHLSVSRLELINVLRQMGRQAKWPQKMKAPDSFRNPGFWCDFHQDHSHKMEDSFALKIEVNELLKKGHLREFLSEKAKSHLSMETTGKPPEAAPVSPRRHDRVIHIISGGLGISGISHAAAKKSTWNAKHSLEVAKPKRLLLGTDEISFTAKEQEKVLTPHHDALVISLTVANNLVKRILVDNGSSSNIIFQAAYKDLVLEESALTKRITPLIAFSGEVKQTAGETTLKGKTKVLEQLQSKPPAHHTEEPESPETSDPCQPLQKVARPQWHVHKIKMGMRHKAGMEVEYSIGTRYWPASERHNAKSKQVPVVAEGGVWVPKIKKELEPMCSLRRIGVITTSRNLQKEDRTPVQPRAHRGHYIPKNLRVPMRPQGPNTNTRVPIRSPDLEENLVFSHDLRVQSRSRKPQGSNYELWIDKGIFWFLYRPRDPVMIPGSRKGPLGSSTTSGSPDDLRVLTQPSGYKNNLRTPRVHIFARNLRVYIPSPGILLFSLRKERDHGLHSPTSIEKQAEGYPLKKKHAKHYYQKHAKQQEGVDKGEKL